MRAARLTTRALVACLAISAALQSADAAILIMPDDGWATWEVPATPDTPYWCCYEGWKQDSVQTTCQLDNHNYSYGSRDREREQSAGSVRMYARFEAGKLTRLRTLAASCPVAADSPMRTVPNVTLESSVKWLQSQLPKDERSRLSSEVIGAIATHQGNAARDVVAGIAKSDTVVKNRRDAMFWLTQVRGAEGFDIVAPYLAGDPDTKIREHAAFSLSQSRARPAAPLLLRAAHDDADREVRSKAWFWLAQTKAPETEKAIRSSLNKEQERRVRDQMIFALSQLPAERSTPALIAIAEDTTLQRDDRKKAIFWMSQSKSDLALQYLDKVLAAK